MKIVYEKGDKVFYTNRDGERMPAEVIKESALSHRVTIKLVKRNAPKVDLVVRAVNLELRTK